MKKVILIVGAIVVVAGVVLIGRERAQEKAGEASGLSSAEQDSVATTVENVDATPSSHFTAATKSDGDVASTKTPLSAPVKALLLQDGKKHNYATLQAEISKLGYELSSADVAALMDMLAWPNDRFPEKMRPIEINAVKNDVLDKLLRQNVLPEGIGLQLVEMASNTENDPVWRDYCVQFMGPFYERVSAESMVHGAGGVSQAARLPGANESRQAVGGTEELTAVREAMFSALDERDSTIAGTALIGLENLSRTHGEFDRKAIVNSALDIASDESASAASRMTALRLASRLATKERKDLKEDSSVYSSEAGGEINNGVVETARLLAQTGETVLLRSAAIVTLGEIGSAEDRELLESYLQDADRQIAEAARLALAKMDAPESPTPTPDVEEVPTAPRLVGKKAPVLVNQY